MNCYRATTSSGEKGALLPMETSRCRLCCVTVIYLLCFNPLLVHAELICKTEFLQESDSHNSGLCWRVNCWLCVKGCCVMPSQGLRGLCCVLLVPRAQLYTTEQHPSLLWCCDVGEDILLWLLGGHLWCWLQHVPCSPVVCTTNSFRSQSLISASSSHSHENTEPQ